MCRHLGSTSVLCGLLAGLIAFTPAPAHGQDSPPTGADATRDAPAGEGPELKGYCPASYKLSNTAVEGKPELKVEHGGKTYHCASEDARKAFVADPDSFLPEFDGLCTTAMGGRFGNWLFCDGKTFDVYQDKLYLFSSERAKRAYETDKTRYIERARIVFTEQPKKPREALSGPRTPGKPGARKPNPVMNMIGQKIPGVELTMTDGKKISTTELRSPATLMMFYASWCPHCKRALPLLEEMSKDAELAGSSIMAVSLDRLTDDGATGKKARSRAEVVKQFADLGVTLPQAFADPALGSGVLNVRSYPTFVLVNKSGVVEQAWVSGRGVKDGSIRSDIKTVLSGKSLAKPKDGNSMGDSPRDALRLAGHPIPDASFVSPQDGSKVSFSGPRDVPATVVMFYTTYDKFSNDGLPMLNKWAMGYDGKPVKFYGVTQDFIRPYYSDMDDRIKTQEDVERHWKELGMKFPMLLDPEGYGKKLLTIKSYPTTLLIDGRGQVAKVYLGLKPIRLGQVKDDLNALLAKTDG